MSVLSEKKYRIFIALLTILCMAMTFSSGLAIPVSAASTDYIIVTKNDSYNKDNKFWMSFNFQNLGVYEMIVKAKVLNSSGKEVISWKDYRLDFNESTTRSFGYDYNGMPTGKYTFVLNCVNLAGTGWNWKYTINHKNTPSISFKSHETYYDANGYYIHKFNIQCTNLKSQKLTIKIYDSEGNFIYNYTGNERKTNNEVGWFTWSGYIQTKSSSGETIITKYPSGEYTVVVTGGGKTIEKTYNLKLLERVMG